MGKHIVRKSSYVLIETRGECCSNTVESERLYNIIRNVMRAILFALHLIFIGNYKEDMKK